VEYRFKVIFWGVAHAGGYQKILKAYKIGMATRIPRNELPDWPRMMRLPTAAAYLDIGPELFLSNVPVAPRRIGGAVLWDRNEIDVYVDSLSVLDSGKSTDWLEKIA
jgi:hypothetical protein